MKLVFEIKRALMKLKSVCVLFKEKRAAKLERNL